MNQDNSYLFIPSVEFILNFNAKEVKYGKIYLSNKYIWVWVHFNKQCLVQVDPECLLI